MVQELCHRIYPLPARRAAWNDNASAALGHTWLLIDKGVEAVASNF
jgi:hypothetical protein